MPAKIVIDNSSTDHSIPKFPKSQPKSSSKVVENQELFDKCRFFRLTSAISGALALIPATLDYEEGYSKMRTRDACEINTVHSTHLRSWIFSLSLLAILLQIPSKFYYFKWLNSIPFTFEELPPPFPLKYLDVIDLLRKRKIHEYLFTEKTWLVVFFFLINPYPGINLKFYVSQQIFYEKVVICYYFEEVFYFVMFFRLFYLMYTIFGYGAFQSSLARWVCAKHNVSLSLSVSLKCYAKIYPLRVLIFIFLIPGIIVFGIGIRIFERPLKMPKSDFEYLGNSMWCIVVTMTTVGYGDTIITANLARLVICLSIVWGGIILSLTFVTLGSALKLSPKETMAYRSISVATESANFIGKHFIRKSKKRKNSVLKTTFAKITEKIFQQSHKSQGYISHRKSILLNHQFERIEKTTEEIEYKLRKLLRNF